MPGRVGLPSSILRTAMTWRSITASMASASPSLRGRRPGVVHAAGRREASSFAALLEELRHRPVQPVWCEAPDAGAVVTVEAIIEQEQVAPVGVGLKHRGAAEDGTPTVGVPPERAAQAV